MEIGKQELVSILCSYYIPDTDSIVLYLLRKVCISWLVAHIVAKIQQ